jgi:SMC interacting uncharacterized protein involved in chromosome segregation
MHRVETQHLELQDSHSIWLHTAEVLHKVTDNQVQMVQELTTEQELVQAAEGRANGKIHGEREAAEAEREALEMELMFSSLTLVDTLDILADQEMLQKVHQVADQVQLTQMTQHTEHKVVVGAQDFTD